MNTTNKISRILGLAFLLQFITSFSSGVFLRPLWYLDGNMAGTLLKISARPWLLQANILVDMLTALGVIFLGAVLFVTLRKQNEKIALTALGFYILEGALLAVSRMATFSLIGIAQEFVATGQPAFLLTMAKQAFASMEFAGSTLHMLAFCLGAILFYSLLYRSGVVPNPLSLWGLISVLPLLIGTLTQAFGISIPIYFYVPYIPFELVIGIWILIKGIKETL